MRRFLMMVLSIGVILITIPGFALDFDFQGNFTNDNDVVLLGFTVGSESTVTVFSSSWLNGDPPSGFDPMLGIWTASGSQLYFQDDGSNVGSTLSNSVSYNHGTWDSFFNVDLIAGDYIATISQYNNFPNTATLIDGFQQDGNPDFTFDSGFGGATQPMFNGVWDDNDGRTSFWQFHILNVAQANIIGVPEPATMLLLGLGLVGIAGIRKRFNN